MASIKVGIEFNRVQLYNDGNADRRLMELDLADGVRDKAIVQLMAYRRHMKQSYNRRVILRSFQVDDLV